MIECRFISDYTQTGEHNEVMFACVSASRYVCVHNIFSYSGATMSLLQYIQHDVVYSH